MKSVLRFSGRSNIKTYNGEYTQVALCRILGAGNNTAAIKAESMLERFPDMEIIIMTGIAAGVPTSKELGVGVRLGDIVTSKGVVDYDFVKETGEIIELRGTELAPSSKVIEAEQRLEHKMIEGIKPWEDYISSICERMTAFKRPDKGTDPNSLEPEIIEMEEKHIRRTDNEPLVFREKIGSANRLLRNPEKRDRLKKQYHVFAIEMEASGIKDTAWAGNVGY